METEEGFRILNVIATNRITVSEIMLLKNKKDHTKYTQTNKTFTKS